MNQKDEFDEKEVYALVVFSLLKLKELHIQGAMQEVDIQWEKVHQGYTEKCQMKKHILKSLNRTLKNNNIQNGSH